MSFLKLDSFDHYNTGQIGRKWTVAGGSITTGRFGTGYNALGGGTLTFDFAPAITSLSVGFAINYGQFGRIAMTPLLVAGSASFPFGETFHLEVDVDNQLVFRRSGVDPVAVWTGLILPISAFVHIQLSAVISVSGGGDILVDYVLRLNGGPAVSGQFNVGTFFPPSSISRLVFTCLSGGSADSAVFDDLYVKNDTTLPGDLHIESFYPTDDGNYSEWTPNAGAVHFDRVNQTVPDDDTTTVLSAGVGTRESYPLGTVPTGPTIPTLQHVVCAKDDGGGGSYQALIRRSAADFLGAAITPSASYTFGRTLFDTDPSTGLVWTPAGVNAGEFGTQAGA